MAGHRPFAELTKDFSEARKARAASRVSELKSETALREVTTRFPEGSIDVNNFGEPSDTPGGKKSS
jgi:hypothetical protein